MTAAATTITIGSGAAGVLGITGLAIATVGGLAAAAALFGGGRDRKRYRGHRGGYGYGRKRREVQSEDAALEKVMEVIRAEDLSGCGMRLVCELAAPGRNAHSATEEDILNLIGPGLKPGEGVLPDTALGEYKAARGIGEVGGDCGRAFPTCPFNGKQLMNSLPSRFQ